MANQRRRRAALALLAAAFGIASGCSKSEFVPIEGQVLYKDQPLASGVIMFQPPNGPPARSDIVNGAFKIESLDGEPGARIGLNRVRIASRAKPPGGDAEIALGKSQIPEKYEQFESSELTADVKPTGNEPFEFKLHD
jgi:hypothetical protein